MASPEEDYLKGRISYEEYKKLRPPRNWKSIIKALAKTNRRSKRRL